ncbi:MAG: hypothetical protein AAFR01_03915 [Pseudomonadota bacterium]
MAFEFNQVNADNPLILDLLDWIGPKSRSYAEVMDAWRTSCPRLTVWEDAVDLGFVKRDGARVTVTMAGRAALDAARPRTMETVG